MESMVSTKSSVLNEELQMDNNEISLRDILNFFKRNQRLIVFCAGAGLLISTAYLLQVPKRYEARWQMQMAQFVGNSNSEEPAALIQRLRVPTVYPVEVLQSCGMREGEEVGDYLDGTFKAEAIKNVANAVEMKLVGSSPDQAKKCAEAIVAMIVVQQSSLIEERLAGRQEQLAQYQKALREEQQQLEKIKNSDIGNFGYLAKLDKLSWLRTRMDALQEEAMLSQMRPAKLLAPIYVPSKPLSSKKGLLLLLGLSIGFMLGMLYALGREGWRRAA